MNTAFPVRTDGKFTVEEYLAFIASRPEEERWQLIDGVAMMMPPPTLSHQVIAMNLAFELNAHFRQQKRNLIAAQEVGLMVPDVASFRPVADVAVLQTPVDFDALYADRFFLVAEILSDSNTDKDIAAKSRRYIQHPDNRRCAWRSGHGQQDGSRAS
jgi:Uma2 family endonuclease